MMGLTKYEQETVIIYNLEEKEAICTTYDAALIRKLDKLCEKSQAIIKRKEARGYGEYVFPRSWIKVHMPRVLSDEKRKEMAERMSSVRKEQS